MISARCALMPVTLARPHLLFAILSLKRSVERNRSLHPKAERPLHLRLQAQATQAQRLATAMIVQMCLWTASISAAQFTSRAIKRGSYLFSQGAHSFGLSDQMMSVLSNRPRRV